MARNDSRIQVKLLADANAYEKVLSSVISKNKSFGASVAKDVVDKNESVSKSFRLTAIAVDSFSEKLSTLPAVIGGAFSLATLTAIGNHARELDNMARVAGMSVSEFQAAAYASRQFGIEADQLADISKDVREKIGEFVDVAGGGFKDFFTEVAPKIGITADELRHLSGPDALGKMVRAMEKAGLDANQMSFYLESVGSDATKLIPLFRDNSIELDRMANAFDRLNISLTETDTKALKEMSAELDLVYAVISGTATKFTAELAPAITATAKTLTENMDTVAQAVGISLYAAFGRASVAAWKHVSAQVKGAIASRAAAVAAVKQAQAEIRLATAQKATALTGLDLRRATERLTAARTALTAATGRLAVAGRALNGVMSIAGGPAGLIMMAAGALAYFVTKSDSATESADLLNKKLSELTESQLRSKKIDATDAVRDLEQQIADKQKELNKKSTITISPYATGGEPIEIYSEENRKAAIKAQADIDTFNQKLDVQKSLIADIDEALDNLNKPKDNEEKKPSFLNAEESQKALDSLQQALFSEQEMLKKSYNDRREQIAQLSLTETEIKKAGYNTQADLVKQLNAKNDQQYKESLQKIKDRQAEEVQAAKDRDAQMVLSLQQRLMTDEELLNSKEEQEIERAQRELENYQEFLDAKKAIEQFYDEERAELKRQQQEEEEEKNKTHWQKMADHIKESTNDFDTMWGNSFNRFSSSFGNAVADAVVDGENFGDVMGQVANGLAKSMISALVEIGAQRLVLWTLEKTLGASANAGYVAQVSGQAIAGQQLAAINAFASTAAIPVIGPGLAPGAAAAAEMATAPMVAAATTAATSTFAGAFDVGGTIPAGKFGIVGEAGLELVEGPARVTSRAKTERLFENANGSASNQPQWIINVNEAPPGTTATIDEANQIITIAVKKSEENTINQIRRGGPITKAGQQHLNWQRNPSR
ncbi:hypothetical protein [Endozoicomonas sp. Mp262]|uniref:hypothetical protein n=1 Tax=Endozoicomonas sp. Mp262 TaxID=2919499 RepID=UPI0021DA31C1